MAAQEQLEEKYAFGINPEGLYIVQGIIGGRTGFYELHRGYHKLRNTEADDHNVTFIKFVGLESKKKRALKNLGESEAPLSDEACFAHVVRYKDYIVNADNVNLQDPNKVFVNDLAFQDTLVTERTTWQGLESRRAAMPDEAILDVAWDMLKALSYLHGRGMVHGDVRLQNILPVPALGSSAARGPGRRGCQKKSCCYKLIGHGLVPGVIDDIWTPGPAYVAPELRGRRAGGGPYRPTIKSDVWMLGLALSELHAFGRSSGGLPCGLARSRSGVLTITMEKKNKNKKPAAAVAVGEFGGLQRLAGCNPHRHKFLDQLLRKMLASNPGKRMSAMNALVFFAEQKVADSEANWVGREELEGVRDAIEKAGKEMRRQKVMGRVWERLKRLWLNEVWRVVVAHGWIIVFGLWIL